jgi:hypothetical protein
MQGHIREVRHDPRDRRDNEKSSRVLFKLSQHSVNQELNVPRRILGSLSLTIHEAKQLMSHCVPGIGLRDATVRHHVKPCP